MMTIKPAILSCLLLFVAGHGAFAQQIADPHFNARVETPTFTRNFPRVLFDEAHNNFHTASGRYKPFADLMFSDGYHVVANRKPFTKESLQTFKILVIADALGAEEVDEEGADGPAFTPAECDAVRDWVRSGGSLLLIADHAPFASAMDILAKQFGVDMSRGFAFDPANTDKAANNASVIVFSRDNRLLAEHPITNGRSEAERVSRVMTFSGQSLKGPQGSEPFLKLGDSAFDTDITSGKKVPAAGRSQGLAFRLGKGRVVVLGDGATLSAQVTGADNQPFGMNIPDVDNRQLALNIMHWLSGLLK